MLEPIIRIFEDNSALIRDVAAQFVRAVSQAVNTRGYFTVALAGGGTPQALYELLARPPYREKLPWPQMRFFWGDERCVPPDHPQSNYGQARRALLDQVPAPAENIHRVRGEWEPSAAAEDYVRQLRESANPGEAWPRFDWVFLGLGADGHTASLFPGSPLPTASDAPALAVTADYEGRPAQRVTLTPQVLNAARVVAFLVTGRNKADAVAATLTGPRDPRRWPAQRINPGVGELLWWLDQAAAAALPANPRKAWDGIGGFNSLLMMADSNDLLPQIQTNFAQAPHKPRNAWRGKKLWIQCVRVAQAAHVGSYVTVALQGWFFRPAAATGARLPPPPHTALGDAHRPLPGPCQPAGGPAFPGAVAGQPDPGLRRMRRPPPPANGLWRLPGHRGGLRGVRGSAHRPVPGARHDRARRGPGAPAGQLLHQRGVVDVPVLTSGAYCQADLARPGAAEAIRNFLDEQGIDRLNIVVHNAAVGWYGPPAQQSPDAIDELLAINLRAPIALTHALLPRLTAARGVIACVNSVHAALPTPGFAVNSAMRALAVARHWPR
ncbi:6-phosphogluconolactonase [Candidatus Amarolinea dominans]|uniref:6-phosphogluconolactonase n=1 Tax=Candidatus Amarolinea dominans TaxID=3140696 RepID=UPI0031359085|nr:6-phosphogluconolactonase [Anaerolineae bacterium]